MQIPIVTDKGLSTVTINIISKQPAANGHNGHNGEFIESLPAGGEMLETKADDELEMDYSDCMGFSSKFMKVETPLPVPNTQLKRKLARLTDDPDEYVLRYHHYSTMHHSIRRVPVVSAINIDGNPSKRRDTSERKDKWLRDNRIDFAVQLTDAYYRNSKFDKGHMARREDANWGRTPEQAKRNADLTCMYTNACQQARGLNRAVFGYEGLWGELEQLLLEQGVAQEEGRSARICVYNGPVFVDTDPVFKGVQTALRFFKVVVWLDAAGEPRTTAFILSQEDLVNDIQFEELQLDKIFIDHQCSIEYLEQLTGLYFTGIRDWDTFVPEASGKQVKRLSAGDIESLAARPPRQKKRAGAVQERTGVAAQYRRILKDGATAASGDSVESTAGFTERLITGDDRKQILEQTKESLYKVIEQYLGKSDDLKQLADQILAEGGEALRAVADDDDAFLKAAGADALEVIVQQDGSRPSFLIRDGIVDKASSPIGAWSGTIDANIPLLKNAIACVGRIDIFGNHIGTGFLVSRDAIITNLHVLQAIAVNGSNGWVLRAGATIDFGYEYQARESIDRRKLDKVVFCGDRPISGMSLDHTKLDLALISLKPADMQVTPLSVLKTNAWMEAGDPVFTIGYPGDPGLPGVNAYGGLLEMLFRKTFGYKRLAPGRLLPFHMADPPGWTFAHDATTLAGNSGSPVLVFGSESAAVGLHYGGTLANPRQNWAHTLGRSLQGVNSSFTPGMLQACLEQCGVVIG
jgi:DNA/RNA endonuclease G (NUC1)/V8-like Glu-specific endopeptidase